MAASVLLGALVAGALAPALTITATAVREAARYWNHLPQDLPVTPAPQRSVILAADGTPIGQFYSENRVNVTLDQVAPIMRNAIVAIEDSRFYSHHGIDVRGTSRALVNDLTGGPTQGGSTLTQQYVKNVLLLDADTDAQRRDAAGRSLTRKIREAKYALTLEHHMPKDEILTGYLNVAYFGDRAYGIGAAAQHYFAVPASALTLPQAALLGGLVKNPIGYNPTTHPQAALDRRNVVLNRMRALGVITPDQAAAATAAPLNLHVTDSANGCLTSPYPFYCQWVRQTLQTDPTFGATSAERQARLYRGGMTIHTALDPRAQDVAQRAVTAAIPTTSRVATAAVTVQPGTGRVVAMAVNRAFGAAPGQTEVLLPVRAAYQPGSTMKPITLAAALERGFSPATVIDAPNRYAPPGMHAPAGGFGNAGDSEAGTYDAAQATWRSVNTWYVKLEAQVGVLPVADMAARLGITTLPRTGSRAITAKDATLTLGAYEVSPLQMAGVYATFAAHGTACTPVGITAVTGPDGTPAPAPDPACHQAIAPGVANTISSVLQGVIDGPDPARTGKGLSLARPAAGKSGTTNNSAAAWFNGYTPQYATAVWVGDPRGGPGHPLRNIRANGRTYAAAYGGTVAGPIWQQIMLGLHQGVPVQGFPPADPFVATGLPYTLPDVRGLSTARAIDVLTRAGFTVDVAAVRAAPDPLTAPGQVAATVPAPGQPTPFHGHVTLTLTAGSLGH